MTSDKNQICFHFARIPTAKEAKEAGFVMEVVPHEQLMPRAQEIAEKWAKEGKVRNLVASGQVKS
jgi:enoyl-CoA hydratase/carnithine racemase